MVSSEVELRYDMVLAGEIGVKEVGRERPARTGVVAVNGERPRPGKVCIERAGEANNVRAIDDETVIIVDGLGIKVDDINLKKS